MDEMKLWTRGLGGFLPKLPALLNFNPHEILSQSQIDQMVSVGAEMSVRGAMIQAIIEAARGFSRVSPNPLVGCVVLDREGRFLSKGFHEKYGEGHAEVRALKGLTREQLTGAHVIVTLEPCAHQGKTPSCAKMLREFPLAKVTFGITDPNPLVAGKGAQILREAGISVEESREFKTELNEICENFLWNQRQKKVFVAVKVATSLDGFIGLKNGESQWITSPESRQWTHELRGAYDATLVGVGTLLQDNPSLNIRHPHFDKQNKVVILDSEGRGLNSVENLNIYKTHTPENVIWVVNRNRESKIPTLKSPVVEVDSTRNVSEVLNELWKIGIRSVFVEAGAQVASSFLNQKQVQRLYLFQAPTLIGAAQGKSWTEFLEVSSLKNKMNLHNVKTAPSGGDRLITGVFL